MLWRRNQLGSVNSASKFLCSTLVLFLLGSTCAARAQHKLKDEDCLSCHSDSTLTTEVNGKTVSLFVDGTKLKHSIHGFDEAGLCGLPHGCEEPGARDAAAEGDLRAVPRRRAASICAQHARHRKQNWKDARGKLRGLPRRRARGARGRRSQIASESRQYSLYLRRCHGQKFLMESNGESTQPFVSYQDSVHGRAVEKGSAKAAVCTDCHGAHEIIAGQRCQVADFEVQCSGNLRQVPHRHRTDV